MSRRSPLFRFLAGTLALLFFVVFVALGTWQVKRRVWKLDLIARVEQRVRAPPVTAPGPSQWPAVTAATDEYRHVTATGMFLDDSQTLVQAVTELGAGYWVLTPLREPDGSIVLVNRGFVPSDGRGRVQGATGAVTVTGLLRITEPGGGFLRHNDASANRWYSRDVPAIAAARGLTHVAPYFIDADATSARPAVDEAAAVTTGAMAATGATPVTAGATPVTAGAASVTTDAMPVTTGAMPATAGAAGVAPIGGLTVINFHNSHLVYALTWYTLALMVAGAIWLGIRNETRT